MNKNAPKRPNRQDRNVFFKKSILQACFKVFWPMGFTFTIISIVIYFTEANKFSEQLFIKEKNIVQLQRSEFCNILSEHAKDAIFLAELIQIKKQALRGSYISNALTDTFVQKMRINNVYDQIRWIDKSGMELIRIDDSETGPKIVPPDELQDKSERYYFQKGIASPRIYISKFDLNVEHQKIQLPIKPMIRITALVNTETGSNDGVVVLNIKGRKIINKLKSIGIHMIGSLLLVNSDGYFLISPNPENEWAFMYPNKINRKFSNSTPYLWSNIKDKDNGQFVTSDGLVTFSTVDMGSPVISESGYEFRTAESWKIISLVPSERLIPEWRTLFFYGVLTILIVIAGACFYWATARVNKTETQKILFDNEEKFKMVTQTMEDAVIMIDEHDRVKFWSDSGLRMLGYSAKETLGQCLHKIILQDSELANAQKKIKDFFQKGVLAEGVRIEEAKAIKKDGTSLMVEISIMPLIQDGKQYAVGIIRDLSERKQAEAEKENLLELSNTDGLTGLANRRSFDEVLQDEYSRHSRSGGDLSLIFIDIDHFKAFNDTYGHVSGDRCLQRVAHVLGKCAHRRSDIVARYGGEEFACILPETGNHGAVALAKKIQKNIIALAIPNEGSSVAPHLTVSIGVATVSCTIDQTPEFLLSQADKQVYAAKESGRNRIESVDLSDTRHDIDRNIIQLIWQDSFYCGHELIDRQHKALFNLSNKMFSAITSNRPVSEISNLFAKLIEELRQHFTDEEEVMQNIGYTETTNHTIEHCRLITEAMKLQESFKTSIPDVGDTFHFFVKEIVMLHMIGMDRDYYPFVDKD
jgi:diguanylate cyclase (GGDEF)-like protein/hemerythrin-like metal-binding protein/PAS domain S-box-containing protein